MISEYDQRQIALMKQQISNFENKKISLGSLISDLESLLGLIEGASLLLKRAVDNEIEILEEVYADALDRQKDLSPFAESLVLNSIEKIKLYVNELDKN